MKTKDRITQADIRCFIKHKLSTSSLWQCKGLVAIYNRQTPEEQTIGDTVEDNGIGFSGADAEILSSLAEQYRSRGSLSVKQMAILKKKMPKYWRQIAGISNPDKLLEQVKAFKNAPVRV